MFLAFTVREVGRSFIEKTRKLCGHYIDSLEPFRLGNATENTNVSQPNDSLRRTKLNFFCLLQFPSFQ